MKQLVILIISLLFVSRGTQAQDLKTIKNHTLAFDEEYTVLASNPRIKHGDYKKYREDESQSWSGKMENNVQVGEWKYYENGELDQTYDYSLHKMVFQRKKSEPIPAVINHQTKSEVLDTPPTYVGSKIALTDELNKLVQYPFEARRRNIEGDVTLTCWIDETGKLGEIEIVKGLTKECDIELVKKLKKIPAQWISGTLGGKKVKSKLTCIIKYQIAFVFEEMAVAVQ